MFVLRVWDAGAEPPFDIPVRHDLQIGRAAPQGDCLLRDANAGRVAARVVMVDGRPHLEDLGSRNPTAIRGGPRLQKGERLELKSGMVIEIGRSSLMVVAAPQAGHVDPERTLPGDVPGSPTLIAGPKYDPRDEKTDPAEVLGDMTMRAPAPGVKPNSPPLRNEPQQPHVSPVSAPPHAAPRAEARSAPHPAPHVAPHSAPGNNPPSAPPSPPRIPPAPAVPPPSATESSTARPVPAELPKPVHNIRRMSDDAWNQPIGDGGTLKIGGASDDKLAVIGALRNARGRLVIVNDADRRIVPIESQTFTIGRESGDCRLNHAGVSHPHAKIKFTITTLSFQIEDLGSTNQTVLGTVVLNPMVPQPLTPEALLRFGPIEAVFVVARDSSNEVIAPSRYETALQFLLADKAISPDEARAASAEAASGERHVGEALMMAGVINARVWTRAFEMAATYRATSAAPLRKKTKMSIAIAAAVLLVIVVLVWIFRGSLGQ